MLNIIKARLKQKFRTIPFPSEKVTLPQRYQGRPEIKRCGALPDCRRCKDICPVNAIDLKENKLSLDMGKCLFCGECDKVCPHKAICFTGDYRLAGRERGELVLTASGPGGTPAVDEKIKKIFGRSLKLRQVSAGGCNACEQDINVLNTLVFDLGRFGVQFVASPRHADGIMVTGPVTKNMRLALEKTYEAIPSPKLVIAVGSCAISGGPYIDHAEVCNGVDGLIPVDAYIPGCPPHPLTILDGILKVLGRVK